MITQLIRSHSRRRPKAHLAGADGRPLCGGGNGGKTMQWQTDIGPANCAACLTIAARAKVAPGQNTPTFYPPPRMRQPRLRILKSEILKSQIAFAA